MKRLQTTARILHRWQEDVLDGAQLLPMIVHETQYSRSSPEGLGLSFLSPRKHLVQGLDGIAL